MVSRPTWTKTYRTEEACSTAAANYHWLASLGLPVPVLGASTTNAMQFTYVPGHHVRPEDLPTVATVLGDLHRVAYTLELSGARLDEPFRTQTGLVIPDFQTSRRKAIRERITTDRVPKSVPSAEDALALLDESAHKPVGLYKDGNPRNFLITDRAIIAVDFDTLTLAPLGYDLAKLIVTLTMTHGPHLPSLQDLSLSNYNAALTAKNTELLPVTRTELMAWAKIHYILMATYSGTNGYRHEWSPPTEPNTPYVHQDKEYVRAKRGPRL